MKDKKTNHIDNAFGDIDIATKINAIYKLAKWTLDNSSDISEYSDDENTILDELANFVNEYESAFPYSLHISLKDAAKRDLLPCPYCGSDNVVLESYKARKGYEAYVQCNGGCMAMQHTITYDTLEEAEAEARRLWNTRTKYFSPRDVSLMTSAEIEANYDDIVKSMKNWRKDE